MSNQQDLFQCRNNVFIFNVEFHIEQRCEYDQLQKVGKSKKHFEKFKLKKLEIEYTEFQV